MCEEKERIQFCTCESVLELDVLKAIKIAFESTFIEGEYTKKYFVWILNRVLEKAGKEEPREYFAFDF